MPGHATPTTPEPTHLGVVERVLSGTPRPLPGRGSSSLGRTEVDALDVGPLGVAGDDFGDRTHHGGSEKALHQYPAEHLLRWREALPDQAARFLAGAFGENLSSRGLDEHGLCIGDTLRIGSATLQVSQGRQPCWKLGAHFGRDDLASLAQASGRLGWYLRTLEPGRIRAADAIELLARPNPGWSVARVHRAVFERQHTACELLTLAELPGLSPRWRALFARRLQPQHEEDTTARLTGPP